MTTPAESIIQEIFNKCAGTSGCEVCRSHMEEDCLFFPELYELHDEFVEKRQRIPNNRLNELINLCTFCGLCPCQDIRMLILKAKAALANKSGLPLSSKILADAQSAGRLGNLFNNTVNFITQSKGISFCFKKKLKVHQDRQLPKLPKQDFFSWVKKTESGFIKKKPKQRVHKVVYFTGCSAGYFFPEVGKATINLLEKLGADVLVPEQHCCSMPLLMEGQKGKALDKIQANVSTLVRFIRNGYKIVCSCPTCGYFFKKLLLENAYLSDAAQEKLHSDDNIMKVPLGSDKFISLPKKTYGKILKDDGYFSSINPLDRIDLANAVVDLGEYLLSFQRKDKSIFGIEDIQTPLMYFAPCHQREQEIGQPYLKIFSTISGTDIIQVGGALNCCGMGGHLGYKKSFYQAAQKIGNPLFEKFRNEKHRTIITDCLSCRIQFQHELPMDIYHPVQLLQMQQDSV
nr:heterodisulfide reductase-related iron-sulfur binding cluster [uncultured Desulfobacter sp.]